MKRGMKRARLWSVGIVVVALTLGVMAVADAQGPVEPIEPSEPLEPATANVEVTVWRSVANPSLLYLSTRPEDGVWRTLNTPLDMSAQSRSGRYHQSNAIAVAVPLAGGGTANVEVTVWRSIANPSRLYISTRPEGGIWRTLDTALDMSARSASGRYHQSNAVLIEVPLPDTPAEPLEPDETPPSTTTTCRFEDSAPRVIASTVKVTTSEGTGTAFYLGASTFVTAAHVVEGAAAVTLSNPNLNVSARIVGYHGDGDIAVLSANGQPLTPLALANRTITPGTVVGVAGYPDGFGLSAAFARGVVSRTLTDQEGISLIQTDAAVSPGNSGGPLFDSCGRVAGVVVAKLVDVAVEGIGFAVSEPSLSQLINFARGGGRSSSTSPPATSSEPTKAQMRALVDAIGENWETTIDAIGALIDAWNASNDSIPSGYLASIARQERSLSQGMVDQLTALRSHRGAEDNTLGTYLEASITYWEARVTLYARLEQYALDRATWGAVLWDRAHRETAYTSLTRSQCAVWTLLYSNPEVACDRVAAAERDAAEALAEARAWRP